MHALQQIIDDAFENRASLSPASAPAEIRNAVEEVIAAYQNDRLGQAAFSLPGCHGRGPGSGRGRSRGMRCPWR